MQHRLSAIMRSKLLLAPLAAAVASLLSFTVAYAQPMNTSALKKTDFVLQLDQDIDPASDKETWEPVLETRPEERLAVNRARCDCGVNGKLRLIIKLVPGAGMGANPPLSSSTGTITLVAGPAACVAADLTTREAAKRSGACVNLGDPIPVSTLVQSRQEIFTFTVRQLFAARTGAATSDAGVTDDCNVDQLEQNLWLFVNADKNEEPDLAGDQAPSRKLVIDGLAPPAPMVNAPRPGEGRLNISWSAVEGAADLERYLLFCEQAGKPVKTKPPASSSEYSTTATVCGQAGPSDPIEARNVMYLCGSVGRNTTSAAISDLTNGTTYRVGVAAVDRHGNASPITTAVLGTPAPTEDFFERYRSRGGADDGGYCAVGVVGRSGERGLAVGMFSLLALAGVLVARRRRGGRS